MWTSDASAGFSLGRAALLALAALVCASLVAALAAAPSLVAPRDGARGRERRRARASTLFRAVEPLLLGLGGVIARWPAARLRERVQAWLRRAGEPLGLCPDELFAVTLLALLVSSVLALWLVHDAAVHGAVGVVLALLGASLPALRLHASVRERASALERSLPGAMDLCVLCMGAGGDFPAALAFVVEELGAGHAVCRDELARVLDDLALGATRLSALRELGERTASSSARAFVAAVCQAEQRGTPLAEVLSIQARVLRQHRSVRAEEQAARAGVKMMLPMLLLVMSLLLLIFGPFVVNGAGL
jgi:tight adherence protein C